MLEPKVKDIYPQETNTWWEWHRIKSDSKQKMLSWWNWSTNGEIVHIIHTKQEHKRLLYWNPMLLEHPKSDHKIKYTAAYKTNGNEALYSKIVWAAKAVICTNSKQIKTYGWPILPKNVIKLKQKNLKYFNSYDNHPLSLRGYCTRGPKLWDFVSKNKAPLDEVSNVFGW